MRSAIAVLLAPLSLLLALTTLCRAASGSLPNVSTDWASKLPYPVPSAEDFVVSVHDVPTTVTLGAASIPVKVDVDFRGRGIVWQVRADTDGPFVMECLSGCECVTQGPLLRVVEHDDRPCEGWHLRPNYDGIVFSSKDYPPDVARKDYSQSIVEAAPRQGVPTPTAEEVSMMTELAHNLLEDEARNFTFTGPRYRRTLDIKSYLVPWKAGKYRLRVGMYVYPSCIPPNKTTLLSSRQIAWSEPFDIVAVSTPASLPRTPASGSVLPNGDLPVFEFDPDYPYPVGPIRPGDFALSIGETSPTMALGDQDFTLPMSVRYLAKGVAWQLHPRRSDFIAVERLAGSVPVEDGPALREQRDRSGTVGQRMYAGRHMWFNPQSSGVIFSDRMIRPEALRGEFLERPLHPGPRTTMDADTARRFGEDQLELFRIFADHLSFTGDEYRTTIRLADYIRPQAKGTLRFRVGIYIYPSVRPNMWEVPLAERETIWSEPIVVEVR